MFPTIADGDTVELKPSISTCRGEIVLIETEDGLRTHRIIHQNDSQVLTQGDSCFQPDKPADRSSVIGRVARVITARPRTLRSSLRAFFRRIA
jgi:phage repressor protein C with HTH and peptisase S24 domain